MSSEVILAIKEMVFCRLGTTRVCAFVPVLITLLMHTLDVSVAVISSGEADDMSVAIMVLACVGLDVLEDVLPVPRSVLFFLLEQTHSQVAYFRNERFLYISLQISQAVRDTKPESEKRVSTSEGA